MAQNQVQAKLGKYIIKGIKELSGTAQPKKRSASTVPEQARKTAGKKATDLGTPAEVATPGQKADLRGGKEIPEPTPDDTIIARGERLGKAKTMQKSYDNKKKQLERLERKAEQLSQKASPGKKKTTIGRHKANQELKNVKEKIQRLETSMKDMANRYSIKKKEGGTVVPKPKRKPRAKARVESYKRKKAAGKFGLSPSGKRTLKATGNVIKDVATDPISLIPGGSTISLAKSLMNSRKKSPPAPKRKPAQEKKERIDKDLVSTKKGGKVGKKEQGYKARKDESIAMRVKKKRTKKQLKASRHESYGKPGSGKGKGKINRVSSKQTDGNKLVASLYD